ncbi:MAG: hypothetical protein ACRDF7_05965 [Candidatus Limnocylindrales bacterium]
MTAGQHVHPQTQIFFNGKLAAAFAIAAMALVSIAIVVAIYLSAQSHVTTNVPAPGAAPQTAPEFRLPNTPASFPQHRAIAE